MDFDTFKDELAKGVQESLEALYTTLFHRNFHNTQKKADPNKESAFPPSNNPDTLRGFTIDDTLMTHIASEYFFYYN